MSLSQIEAAENEGMNIPTGESTSLPTRLLKLGGEAVLAFVDRKDHETQQVAVAKRVDENDI